MEQAALTASRFSPMGAFAALGELPGENALCVLISFDAKRDAVARQVWEYARQLYAYMQESGVAPNVIGIGSALSQSAADERIVCGGLCGRTADAA